MDAHKLPSVENDRELFGDESPATLAISAAAVTTPPKSNCSNLVGAASEVVGRISREQSELFAAAEEILRHIVNGIEGDDPNTRDVSLHDLIRDMDPLHHSILTSLGWDRKRIIEEARRVESLVTWLPQAGTKAQLAEAEKDLADAQQRLKSGSEEIDMEIAKLESRRRRLKADTDAANQRLQRISLARTKVRSCLPEMIERQYKTAEHNWRTGIRRDLKIRKRRAEIIQTILSWTLTEDAVSTSAHSGSVASNVLLHCSNLPHGHSCRPVRRSLGRDASGTVIAHIVTPSMFEAYKAQLRAELEQLQAEIEDITPQCEAERLGVEEIRDYYIEQLG